MPLITNKNGNLHAATVFGAMKEHQGHTESFTLVFQLHFIPSTLTLLQYKHI